MNRAPWFDSGDRRQRQGKHLATKCFCCTMRGSLVVLSQRARSQGFEPTLITPGSRNACQKTRFFQVYCLHPACDMLEPFKIHSDSRNWKKRTWQNVRFKASRKFGRPLRINCARGPVARVRSLSSFGRLERTCSGSARNHSPSNTNPELPISFDPESGL